MAVHNLSGSSTLRWGSAVNIGASAERGVPVNLITKVSLGAPPAASANAIAASQSVGAAASFTLDGALASGGVATITATYGRNVVAAWTGTAVLTITGTDYTGARMVEVSASGTSHTGNKAFKTVTSVTSSASITGATVGTGTKLGLPFKLASKTDLLASFVDEAADAGTTVIAVTTDPATGTTGDVRGTYTPASAADGVKVYKLWAAFDPTSKSTLYGVPQYTG